MSHYKTDSFDQVYKQSIHLPSVRQNKFCDFYSMSVSFEVIYTKGQNFGIIKNVMFLKEVSYAHQS